MTIVQIIDFKWGSSTYMVQSQSKVFLIGSSELSNEMYIEAVHDICRTTPRAPILVGIGLSKSYMPTYIPR